MPHNKLIPRIGILAIGLLLTIVSSNINWGGNHWRVILEADAKGYYAYLPATFIYNDLNFGFFEQIEEQEYADANLFYDYRASHNGTIINKYYCGTALMQLPFFAVAHGITVGMGGKADGYSYWYPVSTNLAAIFYVLLGFWCLSATLRSYHISGWKQLLVLAGIAFGTNLFYYTVGEPGMSHAFSFGAVSVFVWLARTYFKMPNAWRLVALAATLGLVVLVRPVNGLVLLATPFLAGTWYTWRAGVVFALRRPLPLTLAAVAFAAFPAVQLLIYKISTGAWWVYAYGTEGFHFSEPNMLNILFSYKKGLFLYTPLYALALVGLWPLWRANRFAALALAAFFLVLTYVLSSWWMWYYGGSFSSRVYIEYLPIFGILLALALQKLPTRWLRTSTAIAAIALIALCQIQTYQYRYYQIHWADMTKERYWDVFLRVDRL